MFLSRQATNVDAQCFDGQTALHCLCKNGRLNSLSLLKAKMLTEFKADVNIRDRAGRTALDALQSNQQPESSTDRNESLVVNEAFLNKLGIDEPIGARVIVDSTAHYIVGVVEDFHYMHFRHEIKPIIFKIADENTFNNIIFRTLPGEAENAEKFARSAWKKLYPDNMYEGFFQNAAFDQYYRENEGISNLMIAIASIAILISCMGLFGLVSLFINKKLK